MESQAPAHRVAGEHEALGRRGCDVGRALGGAHGPGSGRRAVPADVRRERAVAFAQPRDDGIPAAPGVGEAVEEDDRPAHPPHDARRDRHPSPPPRLLRRARPLRHDRRMHVARLALLSARARAGSRSGAAGLVARGRAVLRVLRARPGQGDRAAGRRHGHVGHRGGRAGPGRARGAGGPGPPARADGRPPGGAARGRRRPDDRPGQALRIGGEVVLRGGDAGRRRRSRALACRAYWTSLEGRPGVVHLNFPLREPLVPDGALPEDPSGRADGAPMLDRAEVDQIPVPAALERLIEAVETRPRGAIVAGRWERGRALGLAAAGLSETTGYPVLADPLSGGAAPRRVGRPLRHAAARRGLRRCAFPELVIRVGDLPTSKPLRAWLAARGRAADRAHARRRGPGPRRRGRPLGSGRSRADARRAQRTRHAGARRRLGRDWRRADGAAAGAIARALEDELSEPRVAAELGRRLPHDATLVVASSMPVRDVETFFPARADPPRVLSNRGANGIDGTVSTAFGVAAASTEPVVLLIGDVALAHDLGGLLAASRLGLEADDRAPQQRRRRDLPLPPPGRRGRRVRGARGHPDRTRLLAGGRPVRVRAPRGRRRGRFRHGAGRGAGAQATTILEVRTDRVENLALHRAVSVAVASAIAR